MRQNLKWGLGAVLLLALAFLGGRYSRPAKVVTVAKRTTVTDTATQTQTQQATQVNEQKTETRTVVVYRDVIRRPDGTTETKEEEHETEGTQDKTATETMAATETATKSHAAVTESKTTTVTRDASSWHLSAAFGMPITLSAPFAGTPFVIADLSRHLFGPFEVGAWGSLDTNGKNPAAGLSLGVSF